MTLLEQQLRDMPLDQLLEVVARVDEVHQAVHAELDSRPSANRGEAFIRDAFPARQASFPADEPGPVRHGTNCPPGCCGAGMKMWR
jgi:hypothetical protein